MKSYTGLLIIALAAAVVVEFGSFMTAMDFVLTMVCFVVGVVWLLDCIRKGILC